MGNLIEDLKNIVRHGDAQAKLNRIQVENERETELRNKQLEDLKLDSFVTLVKSLINPQKILDEINNKVLGGKGFVLTYERPKFKYRGSRFELKWDSRSSRNERSLSEDGKIITIFVGETMSSPNGQVNFGISIYGGDAFKYNKESKLPSIINGDYIPYAEIESEGFKNRFDRAIKLAFENPYYSSFNSW